MESALNCKSRVLTRYRDVVLTSELNMLGFKSDLKKKKKKKKQI